MITPYPATGSILPDRVKKELKRLLRACDLSGMVSIGIRMYLEKGDMDELVYEIRSMAKDNPQAMANIIGRKAMRLLRIGYEQHTPLPACIKHDITRRLP